MKKRMTTLVSIAMMALFAGYIMVASGVHAADPDPKAGVKAADTEAKSAIKATEAETKSAVKAADRGTNPSAKDGAAGAQSGINPADRQNQVGTRPLGAETNISDTHAMQCVWTGKVSVKNVKLDGKDVKTPYILITEAKHADGQIMDMMKGMELKIIGTKSADALKLVGTEVEVKGLVAIDANSIAPKGEAKKVSALN